MAVSSIGETESRRRPSRVSRVDGGDRHVVFVQEFTGEKGSVRWSTVIMQQRIRSVTKVREKIFTHFHAVTIKHHRNMWDWLFGMPG